MADDENIPSDDDQLTARELLDVAYAGCSEQEGTASIHAGFLCTIYYLLLDKTPDVITNLLAGTPTRIIDLARQNDSFSETVGNEFDAELRREFIVWATEKANEITADPKMKAELAAELDSEREGSQDMRAYLHGLTDKMPYGLGDGDEQGDEAAD